MSHVAKLDIQGPDLVALKAAVKVAGLEWRLTNLQRLICTNCSLSWFSRGDVRMNEWRAGMTCLPLVGKSWRWLYFWALNTVRCLRALFF